MRKRFEGNWYLCFQTCENAMRCNRINEFLDSGKRVFGDKESREGKPEVWVEIDEAIQPFPHGLDVKAMDGLVCRIFGYKVEDKSHESSSGGSHA